MKPWEQGTHQKGWQPETLKSVPKWARPKKCSKKESITHNLYHKNMTFPLSQFLNPPELCRTIKQ